MREDGKQSPSPSGKRSLKDFAHLFLSNLPDQPTTPPAPEAEEEVGPTSPPATSAPVLAVVDGGEGWLRTLVTAEAAILLSREEGRVLVIEEGTLFPTVSGHLGRCLKQKEFASRLRIERGRFASETTGCDLILLEVPSHLPGWCGPWLQRASLVTVVVPPDRIGRLRALSQLKNLLDRIDHQRLGLVIAEPPGSGLGREVFHRFLATDPDERLEDVRFLGALPVEPSLDRVTLPERKPAVVWERTSLTAAALTAVAAGLRRALLPGAVEA